MLATVPQSQNTSAWVKTITVHNFMQDVIEASQQIPVFLDFWAPWCGPCKQLMPLLEKVVGEFSGKVVLGKVNVDENPQIAQKLQVQSVPMVYAFFKGQPVDVFNGVLPESQLRAFCKRIFDMSQGINEALDAALMHLNAGETAQAQELFTAILQAEPSHVQALIGLARCALNQQDVQAAQELYDNIPEAALSPQEASEKKALATALQLATHTPKGDIHSLQAHIAQHPEDFQAQFDLSTTLFAQGEIMEAITLLLGILSQDLSWADGKAKEQLLTFFEGLGFSHPASIYGRKALSKILFS